MNGEQIVEVIAIVVGAVVTLGTTWIAYRMRQMEKEMDKLRATIASVHSLMMRSDQ